MSQLPTSTSAAPSHPAPLLASDEERTLQDLEALAGAGEIHIAMAPSAVLCDRILSHVPAMVRDRMPWEQAAYQATRLSSVLPAAKADDMDKAMAITEIAKAFATYPAPVAEWAADHLMATKRFRPVPADIHEAAKARLSRLKVALIMADRVVAKRAEACEMPGSVKNSNRAVAE